MIALLLVGAALAEGPTTEPPAGDATVGESSGPVVLPEPPGPAPAVDAGLLADRLLAAGLAEQAYATLLEASLLESDAQRAADWDRRAAAALWTAGRWSAAERHFLARPAADPQVALGLAWTLYRQDHTAAAERALGDPSAPGPAYLAGFVAVERHDLPTAISRWSRVPPGHPLGPSAVASADLVATWSRVPHRSPAAAGVLSALLPGAGQAYVGRWGEALSSLLVNGLLVTSAVELGRRDLWFGMGLALFFEAGFYGGNIASAVNGAHRFNNRAWDRLAAPLDPYRPAVVPGTDGFEVVVP